MDHVFALTLLFFVGLAFANAQQCGLNEVRVNCINLCNTCKIQGNCCNRCFPGCDCKEGYYRNANGRCVTKLECLHLDDDEDIVGICDLPPNPGTCHKPKTRYYYNPILRKCLPFIYNGCGGNGNNFKTIEDCMKTCPKKTGEEFGLEPTDFGCPGNVEKCRRHCRQINPNSKGVCRGPKRERCDCDLASPFVPFADCSNNYECIDRCFTPGAKCINGVCKCFT